MKIEFQKVDEPLNDLVFLNLEYMSGDADAYEYIDILLEGITFYNYQDHLNTIEEIYKKYKLISNLTDCNHKLYVGDERSSYQYIVDNYSQDIADIYDEIPGDSTCDGQRRAHLTDITLVAYDNKGCKYQSYLP